MILAEGFGAVALPDGSWFDANQVWSDWVSGGTRANRAARKLQLAINEIIPIGAAVPVLANGILDQDTLYNYSYITGESWLSFKGMTVIESMLNGVTAELAAANRDRKAGYDLLIQKNYAAAEPLLLKSMSETPSNFASIMLGWIHDDTNQPEKSQQDWQFVVNNTSNTSFSGKAARNALAYASYQAGVKQGKYALSEKDIPARPSIDPAGFYPSSGDESASSGWWDTASSTEKAVVVGAGVIAVYAIGSAILKK